MEETFRRTEPLHEGQEHQFLDYQYASVNFIYSFTWDTTILSWGALCTELVGPKGWKQRPLHERVLLDIDGKLAYNYQPSLVFKAYVLERTGRILDSGNLLLPLARDSQGNPDKFEKIPIDLEYTLRLFDNGGGTCTLSATLRRGTASFRNIHAVLHLAQNVDRENVPRPRMRSRNTPLTQAFLDLSKPAVQKAGFDRSLLPERGHRCTLHDLVRKLLTGPNFPNWVPSNAPTLWDESDVVAVDNDQDFQSPFIFTIAEVERDSFLRFRRHPTVDSSREVASILCKLTLDNRFVEQDYLQLSENYARYVLTYDTERGGLANLCLDKRLFFSISSRGAIALTANLKDIPSYFVVPSLLNLCEILRARWHLVSIVGARLDAAIAELVAGPEPDPVEWAKQVSRSRAMFAAFLRDPVPILFDGGSVTEIAEVGETKLRLRSLCEHTIRRFDLLDRLHRDQQERRRAAELAHWTERIGGTQDRARAQS